MSSTCRKAVKTAWRRRTPQLAGDLCLFCSLRLPRPGSTIAALLADSAMRGFAISLSTSRSITSPDSLFLVFFCGIKPSCHASKGKKGQFGPVFQKRTLNNKYKLWRPEEVERLRNQRNSAIQERGLRFSPSGCSRRWLHNLSQRISSIKKFFPLTRLIRSAFRILSTAPDQRPSPHNSPENPAPPTAAESSTRDPGSLAIS